MLRIDRRPTSGGRFARIDVADNDHVNVHLLFTTVRKRIREAFKKPHMMAKKILYIPHDGGVVLISNLSYFCVK